jgi:hypothetical protein
MSLFVVVDRYRHSPLGLLGHSRAQLKDLILIVLEDLLAGCLFFVGQAVEVLQNLSEVGPTETLLVDTHLATY